MPAQTSKSSLFGKIGKALKEHAHDPLEIGRQDLPPGILSGRAKITKCYFEKYKTGNNKGEYYLRGEATVLSPLSVMTDQGEVKVEGLFTSVMFPACATTNSKGVETDAEENGAKIQNALKLMGADPDEIEAVSNDADLHAICKGIQEAEPIIKFKTTPKFDMNDPKKITGAWENWLGVDPDYSGEVDGEVQDNTGGKADKEEKEEPKTKAGGSKKPPAKEKESLPADEEVDLDALAEIADQKEDDDEQKDARTQITNIGIEAGLDEKWIEDDAKSWAQVVAKIKAKHEEAIGNAAADDGSDDKKDYVPEEDHIVRYKGKKDKKPMEYEVTAVSNKKKTVTLTSIDDGKTTYADVKWSEVTLVE